MNFTDVKYINTFTLVFTILLFEPKQIGLAEKNRNLVAFQICSSNKNFLPIITPKGMELSEVLCCICHPCEYASDLQYTSI